MAFLEPGYRLPSSTHFTHLIERKYISVKQRIRNLLQEQAEFTVITTDLWTSIATESYLTVTFHYLNEEWKMKSVISGTLPLSESHTATNIVTWIKELVDESGIASDKVVAFVHDNCKDIENAGNALEEEYGWLSLGCTGHTLQLCVNSGLQIPAISRVIGAGRRLTTYFRKSEPALRALRIHQQDMRMEPHQLIQDVSTRWNSTYYMIDRLIEQRWPITAVFSDHTVTNGSDRYLDMKSEQWDTLTALKGVLHPLQVATTYFSAEYNISVSALHPVLHGLLKSLWCNDEDLPAIRTCKTTIEREIKQRWKLQSLTCITTGDIYKVAPLIACIVDPRFKECKFLGPESHVQVKAALTGLVCKEKTLLGEKQDSASSHIGEVNEPVTKKKRSGLAILLGDDYTSKASINSETDDTEDSDPVLKEVELYLKEKPIDREEPPLGWWKENQHRFPLVSRVAKRYLTIPITSTLAERVFSTAGLTVTRLRSCLTPEHVNMLVYLNKNSSL